MSSPTRAQRSGRTCNSNNNSNSNSAHTSASESTVRATLIFIITILGMFAMLQPTAADAGLGPLQVNSAMRRLQRADGGSFDWMSDIVWQLFGNLTMEQAVEYIDTRKSQGFTVLGLLCLPKTPNYPNAEGEPPFLCDDCIDMPNEPYWQHIDQVLLYMESVGMVAYLLPSWASVYADGMSEDNHYSLGFFVGERWWNLTNILWVLGGDQACCSNQSKFQAMMIGIRDAGAQQLMTLHPRSSEASTYFTFDTPYGGLDFHCAQSRAQIELAVWLVRDAYTSSVGKPVVLVETFFEIEPGVDAGKYQPLHLVDSPEFRSYPWGARMAGSMGEGYGTWLNWFEVVDGQWQVDVLLPGTFKIVNVMRSILALVDQYSLVPENVGYPDDPTPVVGGACDYPLGPTHWSGKNPSCIFSAVAFDAQQAVAYFDPNRPDEYNCATLNTSFFPLGSKATWWDPALEASNSTIQIVSTEETQTVCPPGSSSAAAFPGEWVLLVNPTDMSGTFGSAMCKQCYDVGYEQGIMDCEPDTTGAVTSDPHVSGLHKQSFDFTGEVGNYYALISDQNLAVNAKFGTAYTTGMNIDPATLISVPFRKQGTWLTEVAVILGESLIEASIRTTPLEALCPAEHWLDTCFFGGSLRLDGEETIRLGQTQLTNGVTVVLSNRQSFGRISVNAAKHWRFSCNIDYVPVPESWHLTGEEARDMAHFNFKILKIALSSIAHGVIGQTVRLKYDSNGRPVVTAEDKNGRGLIDGEPQDYELNSLTSTDFKFSAFVLEDAPQDTFVESKLNELSNHIFNI